MDDLKGKGRPKQPPLLPVGSQMKRLLPIFLAFFVSCGAAPIPNAVKDAPRSVIRIVYKTEIEGKPAGRTCSAFYIDLIHLITADHCTPKNGEDLLNMETGEKLRVIRQDDGGLALLESPVSNNPPLKLAKKVEMGDTLWAFGYAYGEVFVGYQRNAAGKADDHLVLDGPLSPGMSGGPVVNENGEVVGVNQMTSQTGEYSIICLVPEIKDLLHGK